MGVDIKIKSKNTAPYPITIEGIVIPTEWDKAGNHTSVALAADDEEEYIINTVNQKGRSLQNLLRERISVEGYLTSGNLKAKNKVILVQSYDVINDNQC